jgi:hypothetical protein
MGSIPPASLHKLIEHLFSNQKTRLDATTQIYLTASQVSLTPDQVAQIILPDGATSLNFYLIYQLDKYVAGERVSSLLTLVAFFTKNHYINGLYFDVVAQPRFSRSVLAKSCPPVTLLDTARMISQSYLESYVKVNGVTALLGLSFSPDNIFTNLQYSVHCRYFNQTLKSEGVDDTGYLSAPTKVLGISCNLQGV